MQRLSLVGYILHDCFLFENLRLHHLFVASFLHVVAGTGAGAMGHGWARAHPLFINDGHEGAREWAQTQAIRGKESTYFRKF